ncbi:MAG: imidazolonepropionase [Balneolaceae bacterium]
MAKPTLYGPFVELITMHGLPLHGPLNDEELPILKNAGIVVEGGQVLAIGNYTELLNEYESANRVLNDDEDLVAVPAFVDCHTHICWAGDRTNDYALRVAGKPYLEVAKSGGGIMSTVLATRKASKEEQVEVILNHADKLLSQGIATIEVKSGYGLTAESELTMLRAIKEASEHTTADLIPTFLGAHIKPKDFNGSHEEYLIMLLEDVVPIIEKEKLCTRADIFVEEDAFDVELGRKYAEKLKARGFDITMHVDQFNAGGSRMAIEVGSVSADHLEFTDDESVRLFANSETVAVALPGASLGLGMQYTPCRKLLDNDACLAIATDWNPGSAPMGDLITQAALLGASEKLSISETLAGITYRAAQALRIDAGVIHEGRKARFTVFPTKDHRSVFYQQGQMKPKFTVIGDEFIEH